MLTRYNQEHNKKMRFYYHLGTKEKSLYDTLVHEQIEKLFRVDTDQRILYLAILDFANVYNGAILEQIQLNNLNHLYNEVSDKENLKAFLGASYHYLGQLEAHARPSAHVDDLRQKRARTSASRVRPEPYNEGKPTHRRRLFPDN